MSKSIYEEAIGQLLKIQGRLSTNFDKFLEVKQALELAIKQEQLLELYRGKDKYTTLFIPLPKVELCKYRSIVEQIKEIENDK